MIGLDRIISGTGVAGQNDLFAKMAWKYGVLGVAYGDSANVHMERPWNKRIRWNE